MQAPALRPSHNPRLHFAYPKCLQPASTLRLSKVPALFYPKCCRTSGRTSPIRSARRTRLHFAQPTCAHPASALRLSKVRAARACTFLSEVPPNQRPHFAYPKCPQNAPALSYPKCSQNAPALRASDVRAPRVCISPRGQARVCTSLIRSAWQPAPALLLARNPRAALRPSEVPAIRACTSPLELHASAVRVSEAPATRACTSPRPQTHVCTSPIRSASDRRLRCLSISTRLHFAPPKCLQPARALRLARNPRAALRPSEVPTPRVCTSPIRSAGQPARALRLTRNPRAALRPLRSACTRACTSPRRQASVCPSPLEQHASALRVRRANNPRVHFASRAACVCTWPVRSAWNRAFTPPRLQRASALRVRRANNPCVHFASRAACVCTWPVRSACNRACTPPRLQRASALRVS